MTNKHVIIQERVWVISRRLAGGINCVVGVADSLESAKIFANKQLQEEKYPGRTDSLEWNSENEAAAGFGCEYYLDSYPLFRKD